MNVCNVCLSARSQTEDTELQLTGITQLCCNCSRCNCSRIGSSGTNRSVVAVVELLQQINGSFAHSALRRTDLVCSSHALVANFA